MIGHPPFPRTPAALSAEVLTEAFGTPVGSFTASPVGADRGMLGDLVLVEPAYTGPPGPARVVAKFAAQRDGSLGSARRSGSHLRELRFYDELAPSTPVRVPHVYASWYDPDSAEFLVVQEAVDVDPSVDQLRGIDIHRAELVLDEVARLHATWWDHPRLATLDWLPRLDGPARRHNLATITRTGWDPLCELLGDALTPAERALGPELPAPRRRRPDRVGQLPSTLIHSDLRADNLLFAPDGTAVTLVDWQGAGIGPPAWDLAYFLSQSLDVDTRRANEQAPARPVRRAKPNASGPTLTADTLLAGYGESMIFGLVVATSLPLISDPGQPRVRALAESMARRAIDALADHGQLWGPATTRQERDMTTGRLDGRVAAISASTRSIGRAVAEAYLAEGARRSSSTAARPTRASRPSPRSAAATASPSTRAAPPTRPKSRASSTSPSTTSDSSTSSSATPAAPDSRPASSTCPTTNGNTSSTST